MNTVGSNITNAVKTSIPTATGRALNPPYIPDNADSMKIEVYKEPGTILTGFYTVTVTTKAGETFETIVDGQTMVLMLGAFISQEVEREFLTLFEELEKRNEIIYAIQQLMPIVVEIQTKVPPSGTYTLPEPMATTWRTYAAKAGLPPDDQDVVFSAGDVPKVIDLLQNNLGNQTRAGEQQLMKLNTQASLRATIYSMMQSNASAFKQSLSSAANA